MPATTVKPDTTWHYTGDISPEDYGGKWFRRTTGRQFQVIELTNMDDACGRDNEGHDKYVVELSLVDLDAIDDATLASAMRSCGPEDPSEITDAWRAVVCYEYGCKAPLESWEGNAWSRMLCLARGAAHMLKRDAREMARRMRRPVNKIGSTAAEYIHNNITSAMARGVAEGRHDARIMAKMHGVDELTIDRISDERPADWMPYFVGYQDGIRGEHATERGLAPEYEQGYGRGVLAAKGEAVAPGWIKATK